MHRGHASSTALSKARHEGAKSSPKILLPICAQRLQQSRGQAQSPQNTARVLQHSLTTLLKGKCVAFPGADISPASCGDLC